MSGPAHSPNCAACLALARQQQPPAPTERRCEACARWFTPRRSADPFCRDCARELNTLTVAYRRLAP